MRYRFGAQGLRKTHIVVIVGSKTGHPGSPPDHGHRQTPRRDQILGSPEIVKILEHAREYIVGKIHRAGFDQWAAGLGLRNAGRRYLQNACH